VTALVTFAHISILFGFRLFPVLRELPDQIKEFEKAIQGRSCASWARRFKWRNFGVATLSDFILTTVLVIVFAVARS